LRDSKEMERRYRMERDAFRLTLVSVVAALVMLGLSMVYPAAAQKFSDWSVPVNLGSIVNSPFDEFGPAISKNGLSLYISSTRPGGFGADDIWVSQRASLDAPGARQSTWDPAINTGNRES